MKFGVNSAFLVMLLFGAILLLGGLWLKKNQTSPQNVREGYGFVMGALGEYQEEYYKCISDCEREDPSKFLGQTHGSLFCDEFCNSRVTELARQGGPSDVRADPAPPEKVVSRIDQCNEKCGTGPEGKFCRQHCFCDKEVDEKCRIDCQYSTLLQEECMSRCTSVTRPNCHSTSWNWK